MSQHIGQEEVFTNLISKKYEKGFHLVDKPEICFRLSQIANEPLNVDKFTKNQNPLFAMKKVKKQSIQENPFRQKYKDLKKRLGNILTDIDQSAKVSLILTEFIQYKQLVLKGFLSYYVEEIKVKCAEKAQFFVQIWNQVFKLTQKLLNLFNKRELQCEKHYLSDNIQMQKEYTNALQIYKNRYETIKSHSEKMEKVVEYMSHELRLKKKEVKKIYNDNFSLINTVNDYKQQKAHLQIQYIDLMVNTQNLSGEQTKKILKRKQELYEEQKQIIKIKDSKKNNMKNIMHEINIEGKTDYKTFMSEVNNQLAHSGYDFQKLDLNGAIENALVTQQKQFEKNKFELDCIKNRNLLQTALNQGTQTNYLYFQLCDGQTQTRLTDKFQAQMIKNYGTQMQSKVKKIIKINQEIQYDKNEQLKCMNKFSRQKVVQFSYSNKISEDKLVFRISEKINPDDINKIKNPNMMEIKYIQRNSHQSRVSKKCQEKYTQTPNNFSKDQKKKKQSISYYQPKKPEIKKKGFTKIAYKINKLFPKQSSQSVIPKRSGSVVIANRDSKQFVHKIEEKINKQRPKKLSHSIEAPIKKRQNDSMLQKGSQVQLFRSLSRKDNKNKKNSFIENLQKQKQIAKQKNKQKMHRSVFNLNGLELKQLLDDLSFSQSQKISLPSSLSSSLIESNKEQERVSDADELIKSKKKNKYRESKDIFSSADLDDSWKQKLIKFSEKPQFVLRRKRQSSRILSDNIVKKYIEKSVKIKIINKKPIFNGQDNQNLIQQSLEPFLKDVKNKLKDSSMLTKKLVLPNQLNYVYSILSSAYRKAYELINRNEPLQNFVLPLYETLEIFFGNLNKQEIYKKMINFVAQLCCQIDNKIYESFLFFLNLDEKNPASTKVTTYDCYLYLYLLEKLSLNGAPQQNLDLIYTNLKKIKRQVPLLLRSQNISQMMISHIMETMENKVKVSSLEEENQLNIFSCCLNIITQIINTKEQVIRSFNKIFTILSSFSQNENEKVDIEDVKFLSTPIFPSKNEEVKAIKKIEELSGLSSEDKTIKINEFSSYIIRLGILSFGELYKESLRKYQITSFEKLINFRNISENVDYRESQKNYETKLQDYKKKKKGLYRQYNFHQEQREKQQPETILKIKDIINLNHVEKETSSLVEKVIGKNMSILYSFSVIYLNKSQQVI